MTNGYAASVLPNQGTSLTEVRERRAPAVDLGQIPYRTALEVANGSSGQP